MLLVTGLAAMAHGTGYIVGRYPIALDVVTPKDKSAFKAGESVTVTVKSSGFTGVRVVAKEAATGREEQLKAALVKSEGSGSLAPKMWNAPWSTAGKKPGTYTFTVTGLGGAKTTPVAKSVTVSVVEPGAPAHVKITTPSEGAQFQLGSSVAIAAQASGVTTLRFLAKHLQTGTTFFIPDLPKQNMAFWNTDGLRQGTYQILAVGFDAGGKKNAEASVIITITGGRN